jgi:hypothetical protein
MDAWDALIFHRFLPNGGLLKHVPEMPAALY